MWLATVLGLRKSSAVICPVALAPATRRRTCASRGLKPPVERRTEFGRVLACRQQQLAGARAVLRRGAGQQQPGQMAARAGERGPSALGLVHCQRGLEVVQRIVAPRQRGGQHAQHGVGRAEAGDRGAHHQVAPVVGCQQAVQIGGASGVGQRMADDGQIRHAGQPDPVARDRTEIGVDRWGFELGARLVRAGAG